MPQRFDPIFHHRRSIRLRGYHYGQAGAYFVTICVQGRVCVFGNIAEGEMRVNDAGRVVQHVWRELPVRFTHVTLDAFVVMPNHVHGIVVLIDDVGAGFPRPSPPNHTDARAGAETAMLGAETAPLRDVDTRQQRPTVGQIVAYLKYQSTKHINAQRGAPRMPVWQRNYYDHIIRNNADLDRIRQYIVGNPLRWELDQPR